MADNRTTVKANITTLNVPSVSNADLNTMLKDYLSDNLVFGADVVDTISSTSTSVTLDWDLKDRIDLSRQSGVGNFNITNNNISDGEVKYLLISKQNGDTISFTDATDITPVTANVDSQTTVLYEIVRKGTNYYARAWLDFANIASETEAKTATSNTKLITPLTMGEITRHRTRIIETNDTHIIETNESFVVIRSSGAGTIKLPEESSILTGASIEIYNYTTSSVSILDYSGNNIIDSFQIDGTIRPGGILKVYYDGTYWWMYHYEDTKPQNPSFSLTLDSGTLITSNIVSESFKQKNRTIELSFHVTFRFSGSCFSVYLNSTAYSWNVSDDSLMAVVGYHNIIEEDNSVALVTSDSTNDVIITKQDPTNFLTSPSNLTFRGNVNINIV